MRLDLRAFTLSFLVHSLAGFIAFQMIRFELVEKKVVELDLSMLEVRKEVHKDTSQKPSQSIRDKVEPQSPMRENTRERVKTLPTSTSIKTVEREESKSQPLGVPEEAIREETQEVKPTLSGEGIEPKDKGEVHAGQPIKEGSKTLGEASGAKPRELTSSDRHGGAGGKGEEDYSVLYSRQNFESIRSLVRSHLEYPTLARLRGWEGRVVVLICLEGRSLCGLSIKESSGYRVLDDAVIRAVQKAHRDFPFAERRVNLSLPVQFTLKEGS